MISSILMESVNTMNVMQWQSRFVEIKSNYWKWWYALKLFCDLSINKMCPLQHEQPDFFLLLLELLEDGQETHDELEQVQVFKKEADEIILLHRFFFFTPAPLTNRESLPDFRE